MGRHLVYLGHLIAYVHFKISRKISPETESLHLPHGFVFNKLGSRWRHGGLIHIMKNDTGRQLLCFSFFPF